MRPAAQLECPSVGKIYSVNEGNAANWNAPTRE